jgi:uncharacterized protein YuzE
MKIKYDKEGDVLYIKLNNKKIYRTKEIGSDFLVDVSQNGSIIGVEILDYSQKISPKERSKTSTGRQRIPVSIR